MLLAAARRVPVWQPPSLPSSSPEILLMFSHGFLTPLHQLPPLRLTNGRAVGEFHEPAAIPSTSTNPHNSGVPREGPLFKDGRWLCQATRDVPRSRCNRALPSPRTTVVAFLLKVQTSPGVPTADLPCMTLLTRPRVTERERCTMPSLHSAVEASLIEI